MESAPKLHQLFNQDSASIELPTAQELIKEKLTWNKWFEKEYEDLATPHCEDAESMELCKLINVEWEDLDCSVIDKYLDDKANMYFPERLTFKDFR